MQLRTKCPFERDRTFTLSSVRPIEQITIGQTVRSNMIEVFKKRSDINVRSKFRSKCPFELVRSFWSSTDCPFERFPIGHIVRSNMFKVFLHHLDWTQPLDCGGGVIEIQLRTKCSFEHDRTFTLSSIGSFEQITNGQTVRSNMFKVFKKTFGQKCSLEVSIKVSVRTCSKFEK